MHNSNNEDKSIGPSEQNEAPGENPGKPGLKEKAKGHAERFRARFSGRGPARDIAIIVCVLMNIVWQMHPPQRQAPEQAAAAKTALQTWPGALKSLEVKGVPACDGGPTLSCAAITTHRLDEVNNDQEGAVYLWAAQNWAQAWMPFAQWRVAHAVALEAPKSNYGRRLLADRSQAETAWVSGAGLIVEPAPELSSAYKESDDADPPMRVQTDHGMVAFFADGMSLPVLEDRGQWKILAQGPADQAARMAAAMSNLPDPGAVEVAAATASENAVQARLRQAAKDHAQTTAATAASTTLASSTADASASVANSGVKPTASHTASGVAQTSSTQNSVSATAASTIASTALPATPLGAFDHALEKPVNASDGAQARMRAEIAAAARRSTFAHKRDEE